MGVGEQNYQKPWDKVLAQRENSDATCHGHEMTPAGGQGPGCWRIWREAAGLLPGGAADTETGQPLLGALWQLEPVITHPKRRKKEWKKGKLAEGVETGGRRRANSGGRA